MSYTSETRRNSLAYFGPRISNHWVWEGFHSRVAVDPLARTRHRPSRSVVARPAPRKYRRAGNGAYSHSRYGDRDQYVTFQCEYVAKSGEILLEGEARVIAPDIKLRRPRVTAAARPCRGCPTPAASRCGAQIQSMRTAIVHPAIGCPRQRDGGNGGCAHRAGAYRPSCQNPPSGGGCWARSQGYGDRRCPHSHAAAERAVALGRDAKIDAIMKGASTRMNSWPR